MRPLFTTTILLLGLFALQAQPQLTVPTLSPYSEVTQEVGLTEIKLQYSRPSRKGRTVFGDLVPYEQLWRTGANAATRLTFTEAVKIAGNDLPAGTYALYTIPGKDQWTIIIHTNTGHRSLAGDTYKAEEDAFRFTVPVIENPLRVETFTIQFTALSTNSCELELAWEHTLIRFPIEVEVDSKIDAQMVALLEDPDQIRHATYFRAAEYYLHNARDLEAAISWIDEALNKSPENPRYGLLKGKILAAQGKTVEACRVVETAHDWALLQNNSNYEEQTRLYLEELKKE